VLDAECRVKRANPQFFALFDTTPADTLGRSLFDLGNGQWNVPVLRHLLDEVLPQQNPFTDYEVAHDFPGVGHKVILLNACQLPLTGKRDMILLALEDVTDRRKLEAELVSRANTFVAMLAHELRNPLAPILTAIEVVRTAEPNGAVWHRALATIERQVKQSTRLIEDLLEVSRVTRGKIDLRAEEVELRGLIEQAIETVRPTIEALEHDFRVTLPWRPTWVRVDPTRIQQVVSNLLQNAAKYTPRGGRIGLEVKADAAANRLELVVTDSGVGIDADVLPKVFDLFIQEDRSLSRAAGGLGIGLTMVKGLVEMHGGSVRAESDGRDKGSRFTVTLPYQTVEKPISKPTVATATSGGLTIAVIDDNADAADTTTMLLQAWGHTVHTAYDGVAGLDLIRRVHPDVALLDIGLPRMNGYEVAARLVAEKLVPTLLVAVTGYGHDADRQRAEWAGFHSHLVKPARPDDLARLLAAVTRSTAS
jgi:two-component system, chemotaxis family, CheB/CheR fusion protein